MPTYIVTQRWHGDYEGKFDILESFSSEKAARWYREKILKARFSKALFNEPVNDPAWKREQRADLEIWKKV